MDETLMFSLFAVGYILAINGFAEAMKRIPVAQRLARFVAGDGWLQVWIMAAGALSGPVVVPMALELSGTSATLGEHVTPLRTALIGCG
ncbi:hypothetical protein, partial [Oenococcus oeni]|uniref:hypothetical protein n=1 Tax=Oenococcus oeni TaxID=1247 RepID=UPI001C5AC5E2